MGRTSLKAKGMPMSRTDCQRTYRQYMRQLRLPPIGGRTLAFPLRPSLFRLVCPTPKVNRDQISNVYDFASSCKITHQDCGHCDVDTYDCTMLTRVSQHVGISVSVNRIGSEAPISSFRSGYNVYTAITAVIVHIDWGEVKAPRETGHISASNSTRPVSRKSHTWTKRSPARALC